MFDAALSPQGQSFVLGASFALTVAIVGLAAVRYRGTRNPSALFLTTGFAVLAVNILLVILWSGLHPGMRSRLVVEGTISTVPMLRTGRQVVAWWFVGWLGAGAGLLLVRPWWDRRGRKPLDLRVVASSAALGTLVLDLLVGVATRAAPIATVILAIPSQADAAGRSFTPGVTEVVTQPPGVLALIIGVLAAGVMITAAVRAFERPWALLLAALGASVGAIGVGLQLQHVTVATDAFRWLDLSPVMALALVLGALLVDERTDHTRMRRASDRARAVMGGRAEIASMLGHEVKGPVATIRGLAATTITHYEKLSDTERKEFLSLIEQESRKLLITVDQASLGMKVDARTLSFVTHLTDLAVVVRDVLDGFDTGEHRVTFDAPDPSVTAIVDRKWLAEALRQLLLNAATYSPPTSPIKVAVRQVDTGTAAIDVIDAGPGIPEDQREAVFQKFAAWRPAGYEDVAGTGLGMFIARGIVRAHGGDVWFSDRPREGTMLSIRLPTAGPTEGNA